MSDDIRMVDYYYVDVPDRHGQAAKYLAELKEGRVNLLLYTGFPRGKQAQLDFIPEDPTAFQQVARANKWKLVGPKKAFLIQGDNRVGAAVEIMQKLSSAKINITASAAIAAVNRFGMIIWVKPRDVEQARVLLGA